MALKPTIYKAQVTLSDLDRAVYEDFSLTLALHPSETEQRLMARLMAFCLHYSPELSFTKGLSSTEEPDLWEIMADGVIQHWIEVGQPVPARVKKGLSQSQRVSVYAFGKSADVWWKSNQSQLSACQKTDYFQFDWLAIEKITAFCNRNMKLTVTITEEIMYLTQGEQTEELHVQKLI